VRGQVSDNPKQKLAVRNHLVPADALFDNE
jgi:hypothetical protein